MKLCLWQRLLIGTCMITFVTSVVFSDINEYTVLSPTTMKLIAYYPQLHTHSLSKETNKNYPTRDKLTIAPISSPSKEKVDTEKKEIFKSKDESKEDETEVAEKEQPPVKKKKNIHDTRYPGKVVNHKIKVWSWKGGSPIKTALLSSTIYNVMERMSICPTSKEIHNIVLETAAVESLRGKFVKQIYGPALGIYQMEPETRNDLLNWLKYRHKDIYNEVMVFWEKKQTDEWNYTHNIPWQTAMCLIKYWYVSGHNLQDLCRDRSSRATLWRIRYNTLKGKGSVHAYIKNAKMYADASR